MTTLTVTTKGQVTLRRDLLQHLGVNPGQKLEIIELPGGRIELKAVSNEGKIDQFIGSLSGKSKKKASLEQINEAIADSWAGRE